MAKDDEELNITDFELEEKLSSMSPQELKAELLKWKARVEEMKRKEIN